MTELAKTVKSAAIKNLSTGELDQVIGGSGFPGATNVEFDGTHTIVTYPWGTVKYPGVAFGSN